MQINYHYDSGHNCYAEERDVPDPDCDAEVVAKQPLQARWL